jgi:hypothetical protein
MSDLPARPLVDGIQDLIDMHALYMRCIAAAVRSGGRGPRAAILAADGVASLPDADQAGLILMSLTTGRLVHWVAEQLGEDPRLLWRRFAAGEEDAVASAYHPGRDPLPVHHPAPEATP